MTLLLKKRKREILSELNEKWESSGRENTPASKCQHVLPMNWETGQEHQIKRKGKHLTRTWLKSTQPLLSRMRTDQPQEEPPSLLERLSHQSSSHPRNASEMKLKTSWTKYPEDNWKMKNLISELHAREPERKTCHGITHLSVRPEEAAVLKPAGLSSNSARTSWVSNLSYKLLSTSLKEFPQVNGTKSSEENPLTSTRYYQPCTLSSLMKREREAWEELRSFLPQPNLNDRSERVLNGRPLSGGC